MAGINQSTLASVIQGQPLPPYHPGPSATSPAPAASPPFDTHGTGGPYPQPSFVVVSGPNFVGSGDSGSPGPTLIYQPVATRTGQPAVVINANSPSLPVRPHPAISLSEHLISFGI